jgi:hypothetical protein
MSDYKGAALMIDALSQANAILGDRGYGANWFRQALTARGICPCIPSKAKRMLGRTELAAVRAPTAQCGYIQHSDSSPKRELRAIQENGPSALGPPLARLGLRRIYLLTYKVIQTPPR